MLILGGYVIATPTTLGPADLPRPLRTISHCLLPDLPRPPYADWFTDRTHAETALQATEVDAEVLAIGVEEELALAFRTARGDWWEANPALAKTRRGKPAAVDPGADLDLALPDGRQMRATTTEFGDVPATGAQLRVQYVVDGADVVVREAGVSSARGYLIAAGMSALIGLALVVLRARGDQEGDAVQDRRQAKR